MLTMVLHTIIIGINVSKYLQLPPHGNSSEMKYQGVVFVPCHNNQPFTIEPGKVRTCKISFGSGKYKGETSFPNSEGEEVNLSLQFKLIDSLGKYHEIDVPVARVTIPNTPPEISLKYASTFPNDVVLLPSEAKDETIIFSR